jgi:hypothetical protein
MWIVVSVGIAALVRKLRRSGESASDDEVATYEPPPAKPPGDDPADELRRKLADTRDDAAPAADAAEADATVDERRSEVHDEGRAAIDEMQQSTED